MLEFENSPSRRREDFYENWEDLFSKKCSQIKSACSWFQ